MVGRLVTFINLISVVLCYGSDIKNIYVFGDSFSDTGNLNRLVNFALPSPEFYYQGRFSNGPTWVEYLANDLKANLTNYAYASATTDNDEFPGIFLNLISPLYKILMISYTSIGGS